MNLAEARGTLTPHGWRGEYRLVWKAGYEPVRFVRNDGRLGPVMYFRSEVEAELVAWRRKSQLEQPVMIRDGDRCSPHRSKAEALFKQGRKIEVGYKAREEA